jgi:ATP-binding cassette subfamily B protein
LLKKFLKIHGWVYIPGAVFLVLNSRITNWGPTALGDAIDMLEKGGSTQKEILAQAGLLILIAAGVFLTFFIWRMFIIMNARRMEVFFREELFLKLQSLPLTFFGKQRSGDMMAYAVNDVNAARMVFGPALAMGFHGICTGLIAIWSMATQSGLLMTGLALLPLPFAVYTIVKLGSSIHKKTRISQDLFAKISGFINEAIMGMKIIKSFAREKEWQDTYTVMSAEMKTANVKLNDVSAWLMPLTTAAFGLSYAIALIIGGKKVLSGDLALGELVAFLSYLLLVQQPVTAFGRIINIVQRGLASYKRLMSVYNQQSIPDFDRTGREKPIGGGLEARKLTFSYEGVSRPALKDVSFKIERGQTLGITGGTGSGKTTLAALLLKLYVPPRGSLFMGGEDVTELPAYSIREHIGFVPQDGFLFSAPIRDNILFYAPGKTEEDMLRAAELACIRTEIEAFPRGFDTEVGERGTHLSGGQKQRISLARALVRDPELLILDDTLSAVDNITEQIITANLEGELKNKTAVIISHRLSAIRNADLILFMEEGEIIERGTHEELMAMNGRYHDMWLKQSENETESEDSCK